MIGLERHTVRVVEHHPEWAALFNREANVIRQTGGSLVLDVQHVGSTAVCGLPAKPILDIAAAVDASSDIPGLVQRLMAVGYIDRGDGGREGGYLLVRDSRPEVRTVHLHVVERNDPQWDHYVAFRDVLRRDAAIRAEYGDLKRRLALLYPNDRKQYTEGKREFIQRVLRERPETRPSVLTEE